MIKLYEEFLFEKKSKSSKPNYDIWSKWYSLINMSVSELKKFMDSDEGKEAGLSKSEAKKEGIHSGQQSASWLLKMIPDGNSWESATENWTPEMWYWAGRQNSFNSRMLGNKGPLFDEKGNKTRKHLSLLIWGHNPKKKKRKSPKKPSNLNESFSYGFMERSVNISDRLIEYIIGKEFDFKLNRVSVRSLIPIWDYFIEYGDILKSYQIKTILNLKELVINNILKLDAFSKIFDNPDSYYDNYVEENQEYLGSIVSFEEFEQRVLYIFDKYHLHSDTAIPPLVEIANSLYQSKDTKTDILLIDRAFNISHFNSDLSKLFIKEGVKGLEMLSGNEEFDYYHHPYKFQTDGRRDFGNIDEKKIPKKYLKKGNRDQNDAMEKEIKKFKDVDFKELDTKKEQKRFSEWEADYDREGKRYKTKESKSTKKFKEMYGEKNESLLESKSDKALKKKSELSGIPLNILKEVYKRGLAAWASGHRPGVPQHAWAMSRINSFITGEGGARKADKDLWDKYKDNK